VIQCKAVVNLSVHYGIMERWGAQRTSVEKEYWRRHYSGTFILNAGIDREHANQLLRDDARNLVAFGRPFIANPDLVERIRLKAPLNEPRPEGFYGPSPVGNTDYSSLTQSQIDAHGGHHPVDPHGLPERRSKEVTCLFNFTSLRLLHRTA
jgi:2,4-dienoyl-CoA reductase-like NADH-dependent reductase (Old Yellow Enzyme family)